MFSHSEGVNRHIRHRNIPFAVFYTNQLECSAPCWPTQETANISTTTMNCLKKILYGQMYLYMDLNGDVLYKEKSLFSGWDGDVPTVPE